MAYDSATSDSAAAIYAELAGDTGADGGGEGAGFVHGVGGNVLTLAAGLSGNLIVQPTGISVLAKSVELNDDGARAVVVNTMTIGGLPVIHGGSMPGDCFKSSATYKLRPSLPVTVNAQLIANVTSTVTSGSIVVSIGVKGPITKNR
jgi:hypothetical protein